MLYYIQVFETASSVEQNSQHADKLMPAVSEASTDASLVLSHAEIEPAQTLASERLSTSELRLPESNLDREVGYGIPTSLIHLLARTTALVRDIEASGLAHHQLTAELEERSVHLENVICAWQGRKRRRITTAASSDVHHAFNSHLLKSNSTASPAQAPAEDDDNDNDVGGHSLPRLMSDCLARALHAAILIHFSRAVRRTHPAILQHYVESVLAHLEMHASLKTTMSGFPAARLNAIVWPAFIAACEAIEEPLRRRAVACLRQAAWAGFGNWETAEAATREVWRRRDAGDVGASWQQVVRDMAVHMILT